jgi:hypothetical protein
MKIAPFWDLPCLKGEKPKNIAPLIFEASKKKKCIIAQALHNNGWVSNIKMDTNLTVPHIHEYLRPCVRLHGVHIQEDNVDILSFGISLPMWNTLQPQLVMPNNLETRLRLSARWFGKIGLIQKSFFFLVGYPE